MMDSHTGGSGAVAELGSNVAPMTIGDLFGGLLPAAAGLGTDLSAESIAHAVASLPAPFDSISPERVQRVVSGAAAASEAIERHEPKQFDGRLTYFTAGTDDPSGTIGASGWSSYAAGGVDNHVIETTHWQIASSTSLRIIAETLNESIGRAADQ
jgi:nonribosomal peptide synthetase DhbF